MSMLDIFDSTSGAFNMVHLTHAFQKLPYKPTRIGSMGLFEDKGVPGRTIIVEEKDGVLKLLPTRNIGAPGYVAPDEKRTVRSFRIPHIPYNATILAEDLVDKRAFGSENATEGMAAVVNDKLEEMRPSHEVTKEHMMAGALQGNILDADGSTVIYNLFTEFGVSEQTLDLTLGSTGVVKTKITALIRMIEDALGAATYNHIHVLCGDTIWDSFVEHADITGAFARWQDGAFLRTDQRAGFPFMNVIFENYRGKVGTVDFLPDTEMRAFPVGVPGLYKVHYAPATFIETVNTIGQPLYAKQRRLDFDTGIEIRTESNPLPLCHIPRVLVKITTST